MGYQPGQPYKPIAPNEGAGRKGCGCFAWGCLTVLVLLILVIVGAFYWMRGMLHDVSTDRPLDLPAVAATEQDYQAVRDKVEAFKAGVDGTAPLKPLELTANEINTYIAHDPAYADFRDNFRVLIEGDSLGVLASVPLDKLGMSGRYLSGKATAKVSINNGRLDIRISDLEYNGQRSEQIMQELRDTNLGDELLSRNPQLAQSLDKVKSVTVQDGKLIIEGNPQSNSAVNNAANGTSTGAATGAAQGVGTPRATVGDTPAAEPPARKPPRANSNGADGAKNGSRP